MADYLSVLIKCPFSNLCFFRTRRNMVSNNTILCLIFVIVLLLKNEFSYALNTTADINININTDNLQNNTNNEKQQNITINKLKMPQQTVVTENDDAASMITEETKQWNKFIPGDVRCYCNLPVCVATGYMCKSEEGGCFTDLLGGASDIYNGRHGCLELLIDSDLKEQCQAEPSSNGWSRPQHPRSLLLCCFKDMCNHIDSPEARNKLNDTLMNSNITIPDTNNMVPHKNIHPAPSYSDAEVWFKAATIAVPICGALILLMLIGLAIKILRSDVNKLGGPFISSMEYKTNVNHFHDHSSPHSAQSCASVKKVPYYLETNSLKSASCCHNSIDHITPLLVQNASTTIQHHHNHFDRKNEVLAKFNSVKSVNIPVSMSTHAKLYEKTSVPLTQ